MPGRNDTDAAAAFLGGGPADDGPGPWFEASYPGECAGCFAEFGIGDIIRADGDGGWEGQDCCGY